MLIAGSLGAAACLTAVAVLQVTVGSSDGGIAGPADRIEATADAVDTFDLDRLDPVSAAAVTGAASPAASTIPVEASPAVSPLAEAVANEQLVDIAIGSELIASGILVDGYLITTTSSVGNQLSVSYFHQEQWALAYLVGIDPYSDLAVFRSSTESRAGRTLEALSTNLDDTSAGWDTGSASIPLPAVGDEIMSVALTDDGVVDVSGFVLATERSGMTVDGQPLIGLIDTNVRLPDHRGGVLIDTNGDVVGIVVNTSSSLVSAIPIGDAVAIADRLTHQGWANETWIGFVGIDHDSGVEVIDVTLGGPAANADLRPGDLIRYLDGARIDHMGGVTAGLRRAELGDVITVVVERSGELLAVRIEVSSYVDPVTNADPDATSSGEAGSVSEPIDG